jgi:hypothetical protein
MTNKKYDKNSLYIDSQYYKKLADEHTLQLAAAYAAGCKTNKDKLPFGLTKKELADNCTSLFICAATFCMGIFVMIPMKSDRLIFIVIMSLVILFMMAGCFFAMMSYVEKMREELEAK